MKTTCSKSLTAQACDFARDYQLGRLPVMLELERAVLESDYGRTSWTTRREADRIAELLELCPDARLLDVGAGSGWPGLYFAQSSRCDVLLADVPLLELAFAAERAAVDGLQGKCQAVAAHGAALPFQSHSFDALSQSDVLCCTPAKISMLKECQRVARPDAKMVFSVIAPALELSEHNHRLPIQSGPPFVDMPADYEVLLNQAKWDLTERIDVSSDYLCSLGRVIDGMQARRERLIAVLGAEDYSERMTARKETIAAIRGGLLKREIFLAEPKAE